MFTIQFDDAAVESFINTVGAMKGLFVKVYEARCGDSPGRFHEGVVDGVDEDGMWLKELEGNHPPNMNFRLKWEYVRSVVVP